jgi:hypothetical protein
VLSRTEETGSTYRVVEDCTGGSRRKFRPLPGWHLVRNAPKANFRTYRCNHARPDAYVGRRAKRV